MSELMVRLELLKSHFQSLVPGRIVTRDLVDPSQRDLDEMKQGVFTILSRSENNYANYPGRTAQLGTQQIIIIGQIQPNNDPSGLDCENAEFDLLEDVKTLVRSSLPAGISNLLLQDFKQSSQLDRPFAWILCNLTCQE